MIRSFAIARERVQNNRSFFHGLAQPVETSDPREWLKITSFWRGRTR
jgi:hypothetical protein